MDIRYEIAEKRAAEGVVTLDEGTEHAYLTARTTIDRQAAVQAACVEHAEKHQVWSDDVTIGVEVVLDSEHEYEKMWPQVMEWAIRTGKLEP